jgi:hypothetical protein
MEKMDVKIILFVDDLDRCLEGRNVKVLEAIQLLLNTVGAPVLVFLAIDTRVIAASIENLFNKSLDIHDAEISGQEYLDKIIQLPFCIPEVSPEKNQSYIANCTRKTIEYDDVVKQVKDLLDFAHEVKTKYNEEQKTVFLKFVDTNGTSNQISFDAIYNNGLKALLDKKERKFDDDVELLKIAGNFMHDSTRKAVKKFDLMGNDAAEDFRHSLLDVLSESSVILCNDSSIDTSLEDPSTVIVEGSSVINLEGSLLMKKVIQQQPDWEKVLVTSLNDKELQSKFKKTLSEFKQKKGKYKNQQLISLGMRDLVTSLSGKIECNPRSLKRILNVLQVISEVVKVMHVNDDMPVDLVVDHELWPQLSRKIAVWVFLCEAFPYRMSFLVQRLQDLNQKVSYNKKSSEKRGIMLYGAKAAISTDNDLDIDNGEDVIASFDS